MTKRIEVRQYVYKFDVPSINGYTFAKDCVIEFPEKIPVTMNRQESGAVSLKDTVGYAEVERVEDGIMLVGITPIKGKAEIIRSALEEGRKCAASSIAHSGADVLKKPIRDAYLQFLFLTSKPVSWANEPVDKDATPEV